MEEVWEVENKTARFTLRRVRPIFRFLYFLNFLNVL
jgi:hypothetical protein